MTKRLKIFLIALILNLPFWLGINLLENNLKDFFFRQELGNNPQLLAAQISLQTELNANELIKKGDAENLEIEARAAISVFIDKKGREKILYEKNSEEKLPIASLSKLMTALVVLENYDLSKEIKVSQESIDQKGNVGDLAAGSVFPVKYFLYPMLIESSNDAAFSLANDYEGMNEEKFVALMNETAKKLGLENTSFVNPSGLDPENKNDINLSTTVDLTKLVKLLLKKSLIWEIVSKPRYDIYGPELTNTNKLLDKQDDWQAKILGGKTGFTEKAGGCMLLVVKAPKNSGYIINVVLGVKGKQERFIETKKLVDWVNQSYEW